MADRQLSDLDSDVAVAPSDGPLQVLKALGGDSGVRPFRDTTRCSHQHHIIRLLTTWIQVKRVFLIHTMIALFGNTSTSDGNVLTLLPSQSLFGVAPAAGNQLCPEERRLTT